ncbi:MAG: hypothetical protein LBJ77_01270 [Holosporales bacterium]|jgi:hypothetical protein|nr:hypothetical protein [Holosporales bacterium]
MKAGSRRTLINKVVKDLKVLSLALITIGLTHPTNGAAIPPSQAGYSEGFSALTAFIAHISTPPPASTPAGQPNHESFYPWCMKLNELIGSDSFRVIAPKQTALDVRLLTAETRLASSIGVGKSVLYPQEVGGLPLAKEEAINTYITALAAVRNLAAALQEAYPRLRAWDNYH